MTAMTTRPMRSPRRARRLRSAAPRRVDQVPHRPRLGHRHAAGGLLIIAVNFIPGGQCGGMQPNGQISPGGPGCAVYARADRPGSDRQLLFRASADGRQRQHHRPGDVDDRLILDRAVLPASRRRQPLQPWSKAGIIIKASTRPGSAYAAMMVTGSHGVRMQWDYTRDTPGLAGAVSATAPRWLRLTRSGDTITGYDSADGAHWTKVGTATLPGLPATIQAGMFAASPALLT